MLSRTVKERRYGVSDWERERERDGEAACTQAATEVKSSAPCRCEWCWGESRRPAGGGALWEGLRQPRGSERCGFGRRRLSDAAAGTRVAQVSFPFGKGWGCMLAAALSPTCAGLDCCWDGSRSPLLMGGRSVFLLRLSRSLAVGL